MEATSDNPRVFGLPLRSLTMSERRIMASKFGVNWDAVEVDLSDMPVPEDPENPTDAEKRAAVKALVKVIGPNERFALMFIAVKRELPSVSLAELERRADAGEWVLDIAPDPDADQDSAGTEVPGDAPLPPPSSSANS